MESSNYPVLSPELTESLQPIPAGKPLSKNNLYQTRGDIRRYKMLVRMDRHDAPLAIYCWLGVLKMPGHMAVH